MWKETGARDTKYLVALQACFTSLALLDESDLLTVTQPRLLTAQTPGTCVPTS